LIPTAQVALFRLFEKGKRGLLYYKNRSSRLDA